MLLCSQVHRGSCAYPLHTGNSDKTCKEKWGYRCVAHISQWSVSNQRNADQLVNILPNFSFLSVSWLSSGFNCLGKPPPIKPERVTSQWLRWSWQQRRLSGQLVRHGPAPGLLSVLEFLSEHRCVPNVNIPKYVLINGVCFWDVCEWRWQCCVCSHVRALTGFITPPARAWTYLSFMNSYSRWHLTCF